MIDGVTEKLRAMGIDEWKGIVHGRYKWRGIVVTVKTHRNEILQRKKKTGNFQVVLKELFGKVIISSGDTLVDRGHLTPL